MSIAQAVLQHAARERVKRYQACNVRKSARETQVNFDPHATLEQIFLPEEYIRECFGCNPFVQDKVR